MPENRTRNALPRHPNPRKSRGVIRKAFLPGAGLGTRLRPLTDVLPKPLVPLYHRPLIERAMAACAAAGIEDFAINTHHLAECWTRDDGTLPWGKWGNSEVPAGNGLSPQKGIWRNYPDGEYPLHLFHEPELLETGGGVKNIAAWAAGEDVLVHNGDIFTTLPLDRLIAAHRASGLPVTLALRSTGAGLHIAYEDGKAIDIRAKLGRAEGTHAFSGVYCFGPELLELIPPGEKISVIPAFLELARQGRLGAVLLDEGVWYELGDPAGYLAAHRELDLGFAVHPAARIAPGAVVERSVIGPDAVIPADAVVRDSVVWPRAQVPAGAFLESAIVTF